MLEMLNINTSSLAKLIKPALALDFKNSLMYDYAKPSRVFTRIGNNMVVQSDANYASKFKFESDDIGYLETGNQINNKVSGFYFTDDSPELRLTADYTVEAHVQINSLPSAHGYLGMLIAKGVSTNYYGSRMYMQDGSNTTLQKVRLVTTHNDGVSASMTNIAMPAAITPIPGAPFYSDPALQSPYNPAGKMFHVCFARKDNMGYFFINGILKGTTVGGSTTMAWGNNSNPLVIGNYAHNNVIASSSGYACLGGRIKRLRIYQQCLYTKDFTPSTKAYDVANDGDWVVTN